MFWLQAATRVWVFLTVAKKAYHAPLVFQELQLPKLSQPLHRALRPTVLLIIPATFRLFNQSGRCSIRQFGNELN